jgi:hypothetical protein
MKTKKEYYKFYVSRFGEDILITKSEWLRLKRLLKKFDVTISESKP